LHQATIGLRRRLGSVGAAVDDALFVEELHRTLYAWGIGKRGSRLGSLERIHRALQDRLHDLEALDHLMLETMSERDAGSVVPPLFELVASLDIVDNDARIVAGTKALHHLLPDLVPPMDRAWTGAFFGWSTIDAQYRQEGTFSRSFLAMSWLARTVQPSRLVGPGWRTSSTKVLDNALVGYCIERRL
jgi:hypothetical protein